MTCISSIYSWHAGRAATATSSPSMQLFGDGKIQGKGVVAIPPLGRPDTPIFDGMYDVSNMRRENEV